MNEATFSRKLQKTLRERGWWVVKYHASQYTPKGIPDLICCYKGQFIGLELKRDANTGLSQWQARVGQEIQDNQGLFYKVCPENMTSVLEDVESRLGETP